MPNHLDVPSELASLIEKREQEDRRQQANAETDPAHAEAEATSPPAGEDRRSNADRRTS